MKKFNLRKVMNNSLLVVGLGFMSGIFAIGSLVTVLGVASCL